MLARPAASGSEATHSTFLQTAFWGDFKASFGWRPLRFAVDSDRGSFELLVLVRSMRLGLCFAYVPLGPVIEIDEGARGPFLAELSACLKPLLPKSCFFIRFDPPWSLSEKIEEVGEADGRDASRAGGDVSRPLVGKPLLRAVSDIQTPDTIVVDLLRPDEEILAAMKPKWRYNIRLAEKKGVAVEERGSEGVAEFYALYRATAARDRIAIHPEAYYRRLLELSAERRGRKEAGAPDAKLWIARHEGEALAAIITVFAGNEAIYLYGASSDEKRNLMPAYALQWAAMRAAKESGCAEYDLFGIPPRDDPEHPMAGLYRFKSGFGGRIVRRAGSWDYPLLPAVYSMSRLAESARRWWHKDLTKRLRRRKA
jgi:lipid II:glycine glycyltransferase (peptidoglycan interpeptide bridge formation enzyme)